MPKAYAGAGAKSMFLGKYRRALPGAFTLCEGLQPMSKSRSSASIAWLAVGLSITLAAWCPRPQ